MEKGCPAPAFPHVSKGTEHCVGAPHPQRRHGKEELQEGHVSPATEPPKRGIVTQLDYPVDGKSQLPALHVNFSSISPHPPKASAPVDDSSMWTRLAPAKP